MLTQADKKWLYKNFVTQDQFNQFSDRLDLRFRLFEQGMEEKFVTKIEFNQKMDRLFQNLDIVIGELKAIREESAAMSYRQMEHTTQIDNHEQRLVTLELAAVN